MAYKMKVLKNETTLFIAIIFIHIMKMRINQMNNAFHKICIKELVFLNFFAKTILRAWLLKQNSNNKNKTVELKAIKRYFLRQCPSGAGGHPTSSGIFLDSSDRSIK